MFAAQRMFLKFQQLRCFEVEGDPGGGGGGDDAIKKATYERDTARAETAKLRREFDELKKALPSDEQKKRWADLEKKEETAEEERKRKAGEFDDWRKQITEKHGKELETTRKQVADEQARTAAAQAELNDTLIGLAFAGATDLFSPTGKTVLLPAVAQSYFGKQVEVQTDEKTGRRTVVVKDGNGTVLVDPKTGAPMEFARAIKEVIDAHPDKDQLLRGSGKVGSGSAGGSNGGGGDVDINTVRGSDFRDAKVRDKVRDQLAGAGGIQIGRNFDRRAKE